jgi:hypothetical protein
MAPLRDPTLLGHFRDALGEWRVEGFVTWKPTAVEWVLNNLEGHTPAAITKLMYEYVEAGGEIDQVRERRGGWEDCEQFHFDLRPDLGGRRLYIETTLRVTATGPVVKVVSIHDA